MSKVSMVSTGSADVFGYVAIRHLTIDRETGCVSLADMPGSHDSDAESHYTSNEVPMCYR